MLARVIITPKRGVLDPQGKAIRGSLHSLGFSEVQDVRMGKVVEIRLPDEGNPGADELAARVKSMCERLLANQVIEDFHFELVPEPANRGGVERGTKTA